MLPLLTHPLALIGLAALPALVAIYLLRNRFRRQPVSSLMLWLQVREARQGGTRLRPLHAPLLFFLEALALLLLVLAAVDPQFHLRASARPLVVVLDDSFSMTAGGDDSPRRHALAALRDELRKRPPSSIRFVLAGERPQVLGDASRTTAEALDALDGWRCRAPSSALDDALSLAAELGGDLALLLVVTDRAPPEGTVPEHGRLAWWAFGSPRSNLAFVAAARTASDAGDRVFLEVANLSREPRTTALTIEPPELAGRSTLTLDAGETRRIILQLKPGAPALRARLDDDDLPLDNEVSLLPALRNPVAVDVRVTNKGLREVLERAVRSSRRAAPGGPPELVFTDREEEDVPDSAWVVRFHADKQAEAYTGPFVLDRSHPLTDGVSLRGAIWGAGKEGPVEGAPLVMAGNVVLLSDVAGSDGRHELRWRLRPDLSNLQHTTDWPILIWNVLDWRARDLPSLDRSSVRLGETLLLSLPSPQERVQLVTPSGEVKSLPVHGKQVRLRAEEVGKHEVKAGDETWSFACNALRREESDLRNCISGRWGDWLDDTTRRLEYRPVAWALLLVALAVLALHLYLVARERRARP